MSMQKGREKGTLRSNIKHYIQQQIVEGAYSPGDRIVETRLARELNVSQAPVREAMLELASLGILEERPFSGTYVRDMTLEELEDTYEIRAFLEEYAARRAAKQATEAQFAQMEEILAEMDRHRGRNDFVNLDMAFHGLVLDAAGSPALKRAWTLLKMAEWTYLAAAITEFSIEDMIEQHRTILRHLRSREEASAGAYMFLHIKTFGKELVEFFERRKQQTT